MSVIGIDPGGTCGVVALYDDNALIFQREMKPLDAVRFVAASELSTRVAVEAFRVFPRYQSGVANTAALEVIGALKYICAERGFELCLVQPSHHKGFKGLVLPQDVRFTPHTKDAYGVAYWAQNFGRFSAVQSF